ncbi:MAG: hypothetical protein HS111_17010 [Kofleriaceae bacterium]|nr:hypothetical protein [Kofleriaceae bacterium]
MIVAPVNDHACLGAIIEVVRDLVQYQDHTIREIASRFSTTGELAAWIRSLPQHDDNGVPNELPKVDECRPPQRLDLFSGRPNCVERGALFLACAEYIDPKPRRTLATIDTKAGKHTLPVEDGEPVILDPRQTRNALRGGLALCAPAIRLSPARAIDFIAELAEDAALTAPGGTELVRDAREVMRGALLGMPIPDEAIDDVAITLALAEREARVYGPAGVQVVQTTALALADLDRAARRNRAELRIGKYTLLPDLGALAGLARVGGRIGLGAGSAALRTFLAGFGISDAMVQEIESEMNREGLSLGFLSKPAPRPGSLAAVAAAAAAKRAAA